METGRYERAELPGRLTALGVRPDCERVYRLVLATPGQRLDQLGVGVSLGAGELRRLVGELVRMRLVRVAGGKVLAEPPGPALRTRVDAENTRLAEAQTALADASMAVPELVADFQAAEHGHPASQGVETLTRTDSIRVMIDLLRRTTGELAFLRSDQWVGDVAAQVDEVVVEQVAAGRTSRAIYPVRVLDDIPLRVRARMDAGERVRVLPEVGSRLIVYGTAAAVTTEHWGSASGSRLVVRQHGLVLALRTLFDALWDRAAVPPGFATEVADDARRQLLALMLRGAIDQQIARATGVSLRTVRRRVAALMDELGATSRFGAGVEAARRGWV